MTKIKNLFKGNLTPIEAKSVKFGYGKKQILKDFSLKIGTGEIIGIIGQSGSGKSTFLKLITGVITKKFSGKIEIFGKNSKFNKSQIGYVPQEVSLIQELTIRENINVFGKLQGLTSEQAQKAAEPILELMHLSDFIDVTPGNLSGGQKVRINILLSILHNPSIIILDEPFVGLDYYNRKLLWFFFEELKSKKKTLIMTTHMLSEIEKHANRIYVLQEGKIIVKGTPAYVKKYMKSTIILEIQTTSNPNRNQLLDIEHYCRKKNVKLIDVYKKNIIFNLENNGQKENLLKFLIKIGLKHSIREYKEANMDEALMGL